MELLADDHQAATGAGTGKLNLKMEHVAEVEVQSIVQGRKSGQRSVFRLKVRLCETLP